ncbi:DUF2225 domain-containing protein [Bacillus weihaiensis]|uniref:DUF2225 domain-containing protein n=1 Tax=Bacillus weihaiensis TaxID=1547283 RepID=A0A1L3MN87_9BACI|nr:DUF2225 domain-containing protein [Bacillus weihaiensis]APH03823.1 hypothetical protein A9C19_03085 [Bacillus weihaiensis]
MTTTPEYLFDKHVTCQICATSFITKKVLSRYIRANKHDTDFCSYYTKTSINPLLYYVQVCPTCGFSSSEEFTSYFPPTTKEAIATAISKNWISTQLYSNERAIDTAINSFKLAIYCATLKKEKHITLAGLYLRLSWIYRTEKVNSTEEQRFLRLALEEYVQSYMVSDYSETHLSEIRLLYLIGDLSRRIGLTTQATRYFSKVIEKQRDTLEKGIVEMAKDRWAEMREKKSG